MTSDRTSVVPLGGLYVILDAEAAAPRPLPEIMRAALAAGARLFQYRDKRPSQGEAYLRASELSLMAREAGALFFVNDRCDLALAVDADGVHLGQSDLPLDLARLVLGPSRLIGISTHTPGQVQAATQGGADYLGFGPIFATGTKPDHEPIVGINGLRSVRSMTNLPIFAIGGIGLDQLEAVRQAGADGVAVISAIVRAADIEGETKAFISRWRAGGRQGG